MKQFLFNFLLLSFSFNGICQVAIINDKDGYTNVRKTANAQAEIIYRLQENEVFIVDRYDYDEDKEWDENREWISILISKNNFSFTSNSSIYIKGYIHKSRVRFLEDLPIYNGKKFSFAYQLIPFTKKNKIIEYGQPNWGILISGLPVWGTDMEIPKTEVVNIDIKISENIIVVPKILIADIYECSNNFNVYKKDDTYFVQQWNSDGAGGYELIWVITKEGVQQRFIGAY